MGASGPVAHRPRLPPGYGVATSEDGLLPWTWADERLVASRNYWIVTARANGAPHAMPVWGLRLDGAVVFSTPPMSRKGRNLARDPRVVLHLASGDEVIVVEGEVEEVALDAGLADAYETKYGYRPEPGLPEGLWYRELPRVAYAWSRATIRARPPASTSADRRRRAARRPPRCPARA
jgi:Pyridoxamine 5'-phosphate oxidase